MSNMCRCSDCCYSCSVIFFGLSVIDEMLKNGLTYFPDARGALLFSCSLLTQTLKPLNGPCFDLQEKLTSTIMRFHCKCPPCCIQSYETLERLKIGLQNWHPIIT